MKVQLIFCAAFLFLCSMLRAAVPRDYAVDLKATISDTAPHIVLSWSLRLASNITAQKIHRRLKGSTTWVNLADLTPTDISYTDHTAIVGIEYEYWLQRTITGITSPDPIETAVGFLSAGVKVPEVHSRGILLLVVDDTMATPLGSEIDQLKLDLVADGWMVQTITAPRTGTAASTKALITAAYNANPTNVKAVYLLGHVPVPYSGNNAPDGHTPDHFGAWPADGYYGEMNGNWTDILVNNTDASATRNDNISGDGKFDQSKLPSLVELQVGRVDFNAMTKAPTSGVTEVTLLRRYLQKAHAFRHKMGPYASIPRRSIIRDAFGHFSGENFAVPGWASALTNVGTDITEVPSGQWFSASYAGGNDYLWGYACGPGSYESVSSFGTTADLGQNPSRVVFTGVFGSYHGDWDSNNNLMRAILAGNAFGDSLGLSCVWSGRPHWFLHHLGMGETLGYSTRVSMNGGLASGGSYGPGGYFASYAHMGLMGDPALRVHTVAPPRGLAATSSSNAVNLTWSASAESGVQGYHVYRSTSISGPFTRLTTTPVTATFFNDATGASGTAYTYLVRTLKLETVPGGSYYNLSVGSPLNITVNGGASPAPRNPSDLAVVAHPNGIALSWQDNASDESGFRIERKVNAAGSFAPLTTVAAASTSSIDPGPFTHGSVYFYRVIATGSAGDSAPSNEASLEGVAGFVEFAVTRMKVTKGAGTASVGVTRTGGGTGAVAVNYATSNVSATAGTHYTSTSGQLTWAAGEQGLKTINIPVTDTATPQQARQFKLTLSGGTNGLSINLLNTMAVQIEDPSATLPSPWTSTLIGSLTDSSPAVFAEGLLGDSTMGGSGAISGSTSEAGRFIYQSRTGDSVMTMQVPTPAVNQSGARCALMVRGSTATGDLMAATVTASSSANFGTKFVYRTSSGGGATALPSGDNNFDTPQWVRITRVGNVFTSECSTNGIDWTQVDIPTTISAMPATAVWGIFHYSAEPNSLQIGDYHLATYQNVSLPPSLPGSFAATPATGSISLSWTDVASTETGYELQRQATNGAWIALSTLTQNSTSFIDTGVLPGVGYQYRIRALSAIGDSAWVTISTNAAGIASGYRQWLQTNGLPMDESGNGGAMLSPSNDGASNLMKYALALPASANGYGGRASTSITANAGESYLTFTYVCQNPTPADVSYTVEASSDLLPASWTTDAIVTVSDTVSGNQRTVIKRLAAPISSSIPRFMRLKVTRP